MDALIDKLTVDNMLHLNEPTAGSFRTREDNLLPDCAGLLGLCQAAAWWQQLQGAALQLNCQKTCEHTRILAKCEAENCCCCCCGCCKYCCALLLLLHTASAAAAQLRCECRRVAAERAIQAAARTTRHECKPLQRTLLCMNTRWCYKHCMITSRCMQLTCITHSVFRVETWVDDAVHVLQSWSMEEGNTHARGQREGLHAWNNPHARR